MITPEEKAKIARENGAKSKGPATQEGTDRSRANGLKTGTRYPVIRPYRLCRRWRPARNRPTSSPTVEVESKSAQFISRPRTPWSTEGNSISRHREKQCVRY